MRLKTVEAGILLCFCALASQSIWAAEETADQRTQAALSMDAHPDRGKAPFMRSCSSCHGTKAEGDAERSVPALAGQRFAYLVRQIADFGTAERDNTTMRHNIIDKDFSDPQVWSDVAAYLNRLPGTVVHETGDGSKLPVGRGIFHKQCATCHMDDASGDQVGFVPSLRNQHYRYLVSELHQLAKGHRHNVDPDLVIYIGGLEQSDLAAVADYLSRLHGPGNPDHRMLSNGVVVD